MYVVFDTNIFVSFALGSQALERLRNAWKAGRFTLLVSQYLLTEIEAVLSRDKFAEFVSQKDRKDFLAEILTLTEAVVVKQPFPEFRDSKDRYLLAMLRDTEAEVLVTGDAALLDLQTFEKKPIVNPSEFSKLLEKDKNK